MYNKSSERPSDKKGQRYDGEEYSAQQRQGKAERSGDRPRRIGVRRSTTDGEEARKTGTKRKAGTPRYRANHRRRLQYTEEAELVRETGTQIRRNRGKTADRRGVGSPKDWKAEECWNTNRYSEPTGEMKLRADGGEGLEIGMRSKQNRWKVVECRGSGRERETWRGSKTMRSKSV